MNGDNKINFGDKLGFIVGFIAVIFTLYSFDPKIKSMELNVLLGIYSFNKILFIFLCSLGVSLYFYSLNYIRLDFPYLLKIKWLKFLESGGKIFYLLAFIYSLIIIILVILGFIFSWFSKDNFNFSQVLISSLLSTISGILAALFVSKQQKNNLSTFLEERKENKEKAFSEANYDFDNEKYNYVPIHLFKMILEKIESILVKEYGYGISKIPIFRLIRFALEKNIIKEEDYAFIQKLRKIRNQVAHSHTEKTPPLSKEKTKELFRETKQLTKKLDRILNKQ